MAFVSALLERKVKITDCPHLLESKMKKNLQEIVKLITPPQRPLEFGVGKRKCTIGGEEVLFRHQLTFFNKTAIAIEVHDELPELLNIIKYVTNIAISRIGEQLTVDAIALRCVSGDSNKFTATARQITENSDLPLILVSWDAKILEVAAEAVREKRPLLYAATKENWKEVGKTAATLQLPLACYSRDLNDLATLTTSLNKMGVKELCIDPGTFHGEGLQGFTFDHISKLRYASIEAGYPEVGWPIIGVPATLWAEKAVEDESNWELKYSEVVIATILMSVDTSLLIMHTGRNPDDIWAILALVTYRQNVFTDPRIYPRVDPGIYKIGDPTRMSSIFVTTNYRMTKIPVEEDIRAGKIDAYLLVVDTNGIGVESAVVGGQFNASKIAEALQEFQAFNNVDHRVVVIPGMAARYSGALEDEADCYVCVGPRDSSGIPKWTEEKWNPSAFMEEYSARKG